MINIHYQYLPEILDLYYNYYNRIMENTEKIHKTVMEYNRIILNRIRKGCDKEFPADHKKFDLCVSYSIAQHIFGVQKKKSQG